VQAAPGQLAKGSGLGAPPLLCHGVMHFLSCAVLCCGRVSTQAPITQERWGVTGMLGLRLPVRPALLSGKPHC